jgi:hypothetical protein
MEHGRHSSKPRAARARVRGLASAAALLAALAPSAPAQERTAVPDSCESTIAAVLDDIARRDLDTAGGPPLNAFLTSTPTRSHRRKRSTARSSPATGAARCSARRWR